MAKKRREWKAWALKDKYSSAMNLLLYSKRKFARKDPCKTKHQHIIRVRIVEE